MLITFRKSICTWKQDLPLLYLVSFDSEISSTRNYCDWFWVMYFWNFIKYMYCSHFLGLVKCHYKTRTLSKYYNWSIKSYIMGKLKSTKLCLFLCWISLTCAYLKEIASNLSHWLHLYAQKYSSLNFFIYTGIFLVNVNCKYRHEYLEGVVFKFIKMFIPQEVRCLYRIS